MAKTICDLEGRVVLRKEVEIHNGINQFEINVNDLANNVYLVRIPDNKEYLPIKFVKI